MSQQQYKQLMEVNLSKPLPPEFEQLAQLYMLQSDCKAWMREGLSRYIESSKAVR